MCSRAIDHGDSNLQNQGSIEKFRNGNVVEASLGLFWKPIPNGLTFDNMTLQPHPDDIAECVLKTFNALPAKFKPRHLADGRREWVPLAGIVLSRGDRRSKTIEDMCRKC